MKSFMMLLSLGTAMLCGACASPQKYVATEPVGPSPLQRAENVQTGVLQVYSARKEANVDLNQQIFFWNNDFGKNNFMYQPAHTDYKIYTMDGKFLKRVRNAHGENDAEPTEIALPPGKYKIQAEAEAGNVTTVDMTVPIVIKPGELTAVHLEQNWKPSQKVQDKELLAQAPDGRYIGWNAAPSAMAKK